MLLGPQHLTYNDEFVQAMVNDRINALQDYNWGICHLELNSHGIENGIIEILALKAIFSDGTLVTIPGNAFCPILSVNPENAAKRLNIYIGIAPYVNSFVDNSQISESYSPTYRLIPNDKEKVVCLDGEIDKADFQLALIASESAPNNLVCLKIGELDGSMGGFRFKNYVPPLLKHNASKLLVDIFKKLHGLCRQLAAKLELVIKNNNRGDYNQANAALLSLSKFTAYLENVINGESKHPQEIHRNIVAFYVEVFTLFNKKLLSIKETNLLKYDHLRIWSQFNLLSVKIQDLINGYYQKVKVIAEFEFDGTYYFSEMDDEMFLNRRLALLVTGDNGIFPSKARIASRQLMPMLIANSISGLEMNELQNVPFMNSTSIDTKCYQLLMDGEIWNSIVRYKNMVIFPTINLKHGHISLVDISEL